MELDSAFARIKPFVRVSDLIALLIITVSIINVYAARFGVVPDVLLLTSAVIAFGWAAVQGINGMRILPYFAVIAILFVLYFSLSVYKSSYPGFRNSASLFAVSSIFIFFWKYSHSLQKSMLVTAAVLTGVVLFLILAH